MRSIDQPAPCGIVCKTCVHLATGCAGCFAGGGDEKCTIRRCAAAKAIAGCWQCDEFPCEHFEKLNPAWRGLNTGFVELIREIGEDEFARLALKNIGQHVDYGDLRFKSAQQAKDLVRGGA